MVQGLVRLTLLALLLTGCATRTSEPPPQLRMPPGDPLANSPAMTLVEEAQAALRRGEVATAGERLERALAMVPGSSWLYRLLAEQRLHAGDPSAAEGFARRALRHAPAESPHYRAALRELLATTLARQGERAAAEAARERARGLRDR